MHEPFPSGIPEHNNPEPEKVKENSQENVYEWVRLEHPQFDENSYYRITNEKGYLDFLDHKIVRSSPDGTESHMVGNFDIGHRPTSFPSFDKGKPDFSYLQSDEDNFIFETDTPMYRRGDKNPLTGNQIKGRHWAYRPIDEATGTIIAQMKAGMIKNIYKVTKEGEIFLRK